jgi:hypothetical protein
MRGAAAAVTTAIVLCGLAGAVTGCAGGSASSGAGGGAPGEIHRAAADGSAGSALGAAPAGVASASRTPVADQSVPALRSAVIKTATVDLRTAHGGFGRAMDAAGQIATRLGGYVSSQTQSGTRIHTGRLVVRVPVSRFEPARQAIERLGRVTSESVDGRDVTQQFVDLDARLVNLRSQQHALRRLMQRTETVPDTIRVQNVLQGVELQMEEIQGQLLYLRNRTAMSTITVDLSEAGHRPAPPVHASALWRAGAHALHVATAVVTSVIVGAGFVIPVAVLVLLAVLAGRLAAPWAGPLSARRRRAAGAPSEDA